MTTRIGLRFVAISIVVPFMAAAVLFAPVASRGWARLTRSVASAVTASNEYTTGGYGATGNDWDLVNENADNAPDHVTFNYGTAGDFGLPGDWDGNGTVTPGVLRGNVWYLRNENSTGVADTTFSYGFADDEPFAGAWVSGDPHWYPAVRRGNTFYLRNSQTSGVADTVFTYGYPTDDAFFGDWDGDGVMTVGVRRGNTWYLKNSNTTGTADVVLQFGSADDSPVVGDWDGDGMWTPGVFREADQQFFLRNTNDTGVADVSFSTQANGFVIVGDWDGTDAAPSPSPSPS